MPARSVSPSLRVFSAAVLAGSALTVTLPLSVAHAAGAPGTPGRASATTAEVKLDVSLLDKAVDVPVDIALNKVESPAQSSGAMLTANVDGVDRGRPVTLVKAQVGQSATKVDDAGATAAVKLVAADVHAPGLPLTSLLGLDALSASASCPVDGQPTADVTAPARVTVLGRSVALGLNGPTHVDVPAIGSVDVEFSKKTTTSTTAAASALDVSIEINPLNLNVAKVSGEITVASVSCEKPVPATGVSASPVAQSGAPVAVDAAATGAARPVTGALGDSLASTGGGGGTLPLLAGGGTLLVAGGAALWMTRRRRAHARHR